MLLSRLIFCSIAFAFCLPAMAQPPSLSGWDVTWFDEFDGNALDTSKWNAINSTDPTNNSLHAYLDSQVSVSNGNLVIRTDDTPFGNLNYRSGQVISTAAQQYGKWEVRAKLPTSKGMWPAIWLLPDVQQYPWPSQGEIDIMENRGDESNITSSAYHWGTNPPFSHQYIYKEQKSFHNGHQNYHNSFHTYGVEWESNQIRFYVDDVHHMTIRDADTDGFLSNQTAPMNLIINTAVGGNFLDNPDNSSIFPQEMLIDYVHAYERSANGPAALKLQNGSFETNASLAKWTVFGNQLPNVQVSNEQVADGDYSLKIFGQFNGQENYSGVEQGLTVEEGDEVTADALSLVSSLDPIAGTGNVVYMKIDYYRERHGAFGSGEYISSDGITIADGASLEDVWQQNQLISIAPEEAVEARIAFVFFQPNDEGGSIHIDGVSFLITSVPEPSAIVLIGFSGLLLRRRRAIR